MWNGVRCPGCTLAGCTVVKQNDPCPHRAYSSVREADIKHIIT